MRLSPAQVIGTARAAGAELVWMKGLFFLGMTAPLRAPASLVPLIAWLDASDDVLWSRINAREQAHREKGNDGSTGKRFVRRYRAAFQELLRSVERDGSPVIVRIDTEAAGPDDAVALIVAALERAEAPASGHTRAGTS